MAPVERMTKRKAFYWYCFINREAFGGALTSDVTFKFHRTKNYLASCFRVLRPFGIDEKGHIKYRDHFVITFNRRIQWSRTLCVQTLAHEMVHVWRYELRHGNKQEQKKIEDKVYKVYKCIKGML
jgi:hypothetical protein